MNYLYELLDNPFVRKGLEQVVIPNSIKDNLKHNLRPYQEEAFRRFLYFEQEDFDGKQPKPYHLLYNMATGSGKTLIMAGLILYLYEKGYRNFLFFVNSNNIIQKTKDNFLNSISTKYLFSQNIHIDGKNVLVKEVDNFDEADTENINIKFVSIQMLTSNLLLNVSENSLSFEDFENRKLVLIGDEAHHNNADVWGDLVERIHVMNYKNILLEFTATLDYQRRDIAEKYKGKVIYRYDLKQYRLDKYSKEISLIRSYYDEEERILQALILNLYRQELATKHHINLKPVILFKAKRTIKESEQNKENFHKLIENLDIQKIAHLRNTSTLEIVQNALAYLAEVNISDAEIVRRTQANFRPENCLSANNDIEAERNQLLLNSLEDENNPIRAVFAVQKLNEGWDVLNLFDIVRLYEGRDSRGNNPGRTTIAEAQLIGRGARYFPFSLEVGQDKYTRKYDDDINNELKVLEELYYHTKEDSRYISELKIALVQTGVYDDEEDFLYKQLSLKDAFKNSDNYRKKKVFFNKKVPKDFSSIHSFDALGVKYQNYVHSLSSGIGRLSKAIAFELEPTESAETVLKTKDIALFEIPKHVIQFALEKNPFFRFNNLTHYFPKLDSTDELIENNDYLGDYAITFKGTHKRLENISHFDYLQALMGLLVRIESEIKNNSTEYEGSKFISSYMYEVFKDKEIRVRKDDERADGQKDLVANEPWYVYNANYGTSEEKKFVELFSRRFESFNQKFDDIFLIRNERELAIYDKQGRRFEPDFILFCSLKGQNELTYQVFIEPKGKHLLLHDKWKEDFLKEIRTKQKTVEVHTDTYLITAVPFYNYESENEFSKELEEVLKF